MTNPRDPDVTIAAWLEDGPLTLPPVSREVVVASIHLTPQSRKPLVRLPWRYSTMNMPLRVGTAAVMGLLLLGAGINFFGGDVPGIGAAPTPVASPTLQPTVSGDASEALPGGTFRLGSVGHVGDPPASIVVTVPTGWEADPVSVGKYYLPVEPSLINWQVSNRFNHPCTDHTLFSPAPGPGVDELIELLASQPGIEAGPIKDVMLDGYSGKYVELTTATNVLTCSEAGDDMGFWLWASPSGGRGSTRTGDMYRIYALDVDGTRLTFVGRLPFDATAVDRAELEAIIASIDIETPAGSPGPVAP